MSGEQGPATAQGEGERLIQDVSAWVLRAGVAVSALLLALGLVLGLSQPSSTSASYNARDILLGALHGDGTRLIQLGVVLLVLTPVTRVALSLGVFVFHERDRVYTAVTLIVLALTVGSLLYLQ